MYDSEDSIKAFGRLQNKYIGNFNMGRSSSESFKVCLIFLKNDYFLVLWKYSVTQNIQLKLLSDF